MPKHTLWTEPEAQELERLIQLNKSHDEMTTLIPSRSREAIRKAASRRRKRQILVLKRMEQDMPLTNRWTDAELQKLRYGYDNLTRVHGRSPNERAFWTDIAKYVETRTNEDCKRRWYRSEEASSEEADDESSPPRADGEGRKRREWTSDEDNLLRTQAVQFLHRWNKYIIPGRTVNSIRTRYLNLERDGVLF